MTKRLLWDIIGLLLVCIAPWWAVLLFAIAGTVLFRWYLEMIVFGILFDVLFGGVSVSWLGHMAHTIIFAIPLIISETIKRNINV
jgi:hypothetical protein